MSSGPDIDENREGTCLGIIETTWNIASQENCTGVRLAGAPFTPEGNAGSTTKTTMHDAIFTRNVLQFFFRS